MSSTEEEVCCRCGAEEEVEQCYKCDKYICIDCDRNEMGTYDYEGEIHTLCYECNPFRKKIKFKVNEKRSNPVDSGWEYVETFDWQWEKLHDPDYDYDNIYPQSEWNVEDYRKLFYYITNSYLIQDRVGIGFIKNECHCW